MRARDSPSGRATCRARHAAVVGIALAAQAASPAARGQSFDVARPCTLETAADPARGGDRGAAAGVPMDRLDGARSGASTVRLPAGGLRVGWRTSLGFATDRAPLVGTGPTLYAVSLRGEVVALDADGQERWRVATGMASPGPLVLLADGTVVFVDGGGTAVGVRNGRLRWRTRFGRSGGARPAPLARADGGAIVATAYELSALDVDGHQRGRAVLREPIVGPLLAVRGDVVVVTVSGALWTWTPGSSEIARAGSFGAPAQGGAALLDDHTVVAVHASGERLLTYDLSAHEAASRGASVASAWVGPPSVLHGAVVLDAYTAADDRIVGLDPAGHDAGHVTIRRNLTTAGKTPPSTPAEAGPVAPDVTAIVGAAAGHPPPWVDPDGTVAFASDDGAAGVVTSLFGPNPSVEKVADVCSRGLAGGPGLTHEPAPTAGLAPFAPDAFVVLCRSGSAVLLTRSGAATRSPAGAPTP